MFAVPAWNFSNKEKGIIWEVGCHPAYLHLHLLEDIIEVSAVGIKVKDPVFDNFAVLLRTSSQAYGLMEISWITKESEKIYEIDSSDGKRLFLRAPPPWANEGYDNLIGPLGDSLNVLSFEIKRVLKRFIKTKLQTGYLVGHFYLIDRYIESLMHGASSPVSPEDGKKTIRLLECIEKSINTHDIIPYK